MSNDVAENLSGVKQRVRDAALRSGRSADAAELLVVSKTWPAEKVAELSKKPDIYLQVDLAGEESKNGYEPDQMRRELDDLLALEHVSIIGLMCIPPMASKPEDARPWFVKLRELRDDLEARAGRSLPGLSMGMSGDFEVAIEEGSTIVRVGSAIFGSRTYL
jgi:uncharacterized pyridoxal phosphate-containing UPF0001 family protein